MNFDNIEEIKSELYSQEEVTSLLNMRKLIVLKAKEKPVLLGNSAMVKVNCNVGITNIEGWEEEVKKIRYIASLSYSPDTMMDLSLVDGKVPLWSLLLEVFDGPVGYLPHYGCYEKSKGIDSQKLIEQIEMSFEKGIGFITIHPTTTRELHQIAQSSRVIPSTSRGGMMVYKDMILNKRDINIYEMNFDKILNLCQRYNVTLSIGTTYRPATVGEALDDAHLLELEKQKEFISIAKKKNVNVMMEGIGHITLKDIESYLKLVDEEVNMMPLGPLPTDSAIGFDHVAAAIGSAFSAYFGHTNLINVVTRDEHTGGIPNVNSVIEGIKSARVAARVVNLTRFGKLKSQEYNLSKLRAEKRSCILEGGLFDYDVRSSEAGCNRCAEHCPLL